MAFFVGFFVLFPFSVVLLIYAIEQFEKGNEGTGMFWLAAIFGVFKLWKKWEQWEEEQDSERTRRFKERIEEENRQRMIKAENEKKALLRTLGTGDVNTLTGEEFEHAVAHYLRNVGFEKVETTPGSGDFGADLIIEHGGRKIVIQCKRWSATVGVNAVQEVHSAKSYYRAKEAWVITSSSFSQSAKDLAKRTGVRLFDLDDVKSNRIQAA